MAPAMTPYRSIAKMKPDVESILLAPIGVESTGTTSRQAAPQVGAQRRCRVAHRLRRAANASRARRVAACHASTGAARPSRRAVGRSASFVQANFPDPVIIIS
ncbi:MAG: hypothetical protein KIT36_19775 [Alphaproteobacteria bacterium]|nr:hypothetical protein [Alphaproteobacteria bacterium]